MKKTESPVPSLEVKPPARATRPRRNLPLSEQPKTHIGEANGGSHQGSNGEADLREILRALTALKKGDFSARLPVHWLGTSGKVSDAFNEVAELMEESTSDLNRINRLVGKEGKIHERLTTGMVGGGW